MVSRTAGGVRAAAHAREASSVPAARVQSTVHCKRARAAPFAGVICSLGAVGNGPCGPHRPPKRFTASRRKVRLVELSTLPACRRARPSGSAAFAHEVLLRPRDQRTWPCPRTRLASKKIVI